MDLRDLTDIIIICVLALMSVTALTIVINRIFFIAKIDISSFESLDELEKVLTRYMHVLATIGANAPYVGFLGTVAGIMVTFSMISIGWY